MRKEQAEQFLKGLNLPEETPTLHQLENGYFTARVIELSCLLGHLLGKGWLKEENLKGPIIDLGTGSGVGLLVLRKFTTGSLLGIDNATFFSGEGKQQATLILDSPGWVQSRYSQIIQSQRLRLGLYLEPETVETSGAKIGLFRDGNVQLFTKV